jgi:hypothetical protein
MFEKVRNLRSNLCKRVRDAIVKTFEELPPLVKSNATPQEISVWKKNPIVEKCYKKLFKEIEGTSERYIVRIIKNVWPKVEDIPNYHTAWCISIVETYLDPNNNQMQISENILQDAIKRNLVSN